MSLNSSTTVRLRMYSQSLLGLKLFGETWRGTRESYQPSVSFCHRLLTFTAVQKIITSLLWRDKAKLLF